MSSATALSVHSDAAMFTIANQSQRTVGCLLYSMVSRSVSTCAHFMKHHYTSSSISIRQLDLVSLYLGMSYSVIDGLDFLSFSKHTLHRISNKEICNKSI